MSQIIFDLQKDIENLRNSNAKLIQIVKSQKAENHNLIMEKEIKEEFNIPSIYVESITEERNRMVIENTKLRQDISEYMNKLKEKSNEVGKLQAIIKRQKRTIFHFESENISKKIVRETRSNSVTLERDEIDNKINDNKGIKNKLLNLQSIINCIKKAPSITRIISQCIK